jgi:N-methylhydantoinase B
MSSAERAIALEVANHLFASIAEEMGVALMRTAMSPNIKERRDFSCALFDGRGRMLAQAAHIPVHLGSAPLSVAAVREAVALGPTEHGIVNDPFAGGTHLPDITLASPVFAPGGSEAVFWVANRAHHADVGGTAPGSMPLATHIDEEGFRIPPQRLTPELEARFLAAVRAPEERRGDLLAQKAANAIGRRRLEALLAERGADSLTEHIGALFEWSERLMADVLDALPAGRWSWDDVLDGDGLGATAIPICVDVERASDGLTFDFSRSADQVPGPVNAVRAIAVSAVHYALRCLAPDEMPSNDGLMNRVRVVTRPGSVVDALPPAAVGAGNVETSQRITDVVFGALSRALPGRIPAASCGTMNNLLFGGQTDDGREFTYYETVAGGAGASAQGPGASAIQTHMTNTLNTPVEALEHVYPVRVEAYELRPGSGGRGQHRGGDGVTRRYRFLCSAEVTVIGDRRTSRPFGLEGGEPGAPGEQWHVPYGDEPVPLPAKVQLTVHAGDELVVSSPGGGGFGAPGGEE